MTGMMKEVPAAVVRDAQDGLPTAAPQEGTVEKSDATNVPCTPGQAASSQPAPSPDEQTTGHYTNPLDEQNTLACGAGIVAMAHRDIVTVTGPDRLTWLTTLSSQIVDNMKPGDSRELLLLDAQGRISHQAGIIDDGETAYLLTDVGAGRPLADFLDSMRFMLRVEVRLAEELCQLGFVGGGPIEACGFADSSPDVVGVWNDPWPGIVEGGTTYYDGQMPGDTRFAIAIIGRGASHRISSQWLDAAASSCEWPCEGPDGRSAEAPVCIGMEAWEALRIAALRPRFATDVDERCVPHEWDWLRTAVHLHKGCYCGQETVARIINLGRPPRRAVFVQMDGLEGERPQPGATIEINGRAMGTLTSVAYHMDDGWIGLGLVRRAAPESGTATVSWNEDAAAADGADASEAGASVTVAATLTPIVNARGKSQESPESRPGEGVKRLPGSPGSMVGTGGLGM